MEDIIFVLSKAKDVFQLSMNIGGYSFSFYNIFWYGIIAGTFFWIVCHIIIG